MKSVADTFEKLQVWFERTKKLLSTLFNFEDLFEKKGIFKREKVNGPCKDGGVAQLGEHLPCKQGVRSSILLISTIGHEGTKERSTECLEKYGPIAQLARAHDW